MLYYKKENPKTNKYGKKTYFVAKTSQTVVVLIIIKIVNTPVKTSMSTYNESSTRSLVVVPNTTSPTQFRPKTLFNCSLCLGNMFENTENKNSRNTN